MKILIVGSSGLIGSELVPYLQQHNFQVGRLLRVQQDNHPYWYVDKEIFNLKEFSNPDIIINLSGENIAQGRWTDKRKQTLIDSRVKTTELLVKHFKDNPPALFINASAIGFYGEKGDNIVDESSTPGSDFVSQLAQQWEKSSDVIESTTTRLVKIRTGIVLSNKGGALAKMLPAFKLGAGGRLGSGKQYMSWIDINDFCHAILFIIQTHSISGPINLVSPNPETNQTFSKMLSKTLCRPCILPLPKLMVSLLFAQMGEELLLASTRVKPTKLLEAGFQFEYGSLDKSLTMQLK